MEAEQPTPPDQRSGADDGEIRHRLFCAVYASPEDDHARAVLADYLIEQEDPRGDFIALQLGSGSGQPTPAETALLEPFPASKG